MCRTLFSPSLSIRALVLYNSPSNDFTEKLNFRIHFLTIGFRSAAAPVDSEIVGSCCRNHAKGEDKPSKDTRGVGVD
ncbi:hypothetical protein AAHA92_01711 [Salvia divinorum]|uniref:Uncharacterized protein n=1 Tax=Salvia divinorum TaxID=28513 RepID=A0ABD1IBI2_SALDI